VVDNPLTVFFSIFMAVWTVTFIEFWKRETSKLQFEWDAIDFEKKMEPMRTKFELLKDLEKKRNPITDVSLSFFLHYFTKKKLHNLF